MTVGTAGGGSRPAGWRCAADAGRPAGAGGGARYRRADRPVSRRLLRHAREPFRDRRQHDLSVPDPALPFLGIHLTPTIDGSVTLGPNAVLGLARERYGRGAVDLRDTLDAVGFRASGRWPLSNGGSGSARMWNSTFRGSYLAACRKYCPELELSDLAGYTADADA